MEEQLQGSGEYIDTLINLLVAWGPKLVGAVLARIIGLYVVNMIADGVDKMMVKKELDPSLRPFLKSLVGSLLKVLVVVSVLGMIGIQMTSFIAILGAAGLAVGLALSGTLQSFAGGVMILTFKPFKVGDYIDAQGYAGTINSADYWSVHFDMLENVYRKFAEAGLNIPFPQMDVHLDKEIAV